MVFAPPRALAQLPGACLVESAGPMLSRVDDTDDLVRRCRDGEPGAFGELVRRHRQAVARLVHRMAGPAADLEDLVQEVFLQVHRSLREFRGESRFSTWLHRVAVNVVLMHRRALRSRPLLVAQPEESDAAPDPAPLPDEETATRARLRAFHRLLDRLPEKKRTAFVLHEIEGLDHAEIARIVGAPELTVRTRVFYARKDLARLIEQEPVLAALLRKEVRR